MLLESEMSTSPTSGTNKVVTTLMIAIVVLLVVFPLAFNSGAEFSGSDDAASELVSEMNQDAKPWFQPVWTPPGSEIESMLFALQAAAGAGVIGYYFGLKKGEQRRDGSEQQIAPKRVCEPEGSKING